MVGYLFDNTLWSFALGGGVGGVHFGERGERSTGGPRRGESDDAARRQGDVHAAHNAPRTPRGGPCGRGSGMQELGDTGGEGGPASSGQKACWRAQPGLATPLSIDRFKNPLF